MLPIEAFASVISFLHYYDIDGLKFTNKLCFDAANQCAQRIRLFDFSELAFYVYDNLVEVRRVEPDGRSQRGVQLNLASEPNLAVFITEAFRNCAVGRLYVNSRRELVLNALKDVAKTVTVTFLYFTEEISENAETVEEIVEFVGRFAESRYQPRERYIVLLGSHATGTFRK